MASRRLRPRRAMRWLVGWLTVTRTVAWAVCLAVTGSPSGSVSFSSTVMTTFVAQEANARPSSRGRRSERDDGRDEDRPRRRRSRRDADDDYDYSPPQTRSGGGNTLGVMSLIFGILSYPLMCCCYLNIPTALVAIVCGAIGMSNPQSKGLSIAGLILGGLNLLFFGCLFLLGFAANFNQIGR